MMNINRFALFPMLRNESVADARILGRVGSYLKGIQEGTTSAEKLLSLGGLEELNNNLLQTGRITMPEWERVSNYINDMVRFFM